MAVQLRLALAGSLAAVGFHTLYVRQERAKTPKGRLLQFSPGSADDVLSDNLATGDLILFSRDSKLYYLPAALLSMLRKKTGGTEFDQAGMIVVIRGIPHVLEQSSLEMKLRRYDARVKSSRSKEIVIRRLQPALEAGQLQALHTFLHQQKLLVAAQPPTVASEEEQLVAGKQKDYAGVLGELVKTVAGGGRADCNASVMAVERLYCDVLGLQRKEQQAGWRMKQLLFPEQPLQRQSRLSEPLWVRDLL